MDWTSKSTLRCGIKNIVSAIMDDRGPHPRYFLLHFQKTKTPGYFVLFLSTLVATPLATYVLYYIFPGFFNTQNPRIFCPKKLLPPTKYPVPLPETHTCQFSKAKESHRGSPRIPLQIPRVIPPKDPHFHVITDFATSATGIRWREIKITASLSFSLLYYLSFSLSSYT